MALERRVCRQGVVFPLWSSSGWLMAPVSALVTSLPPRSLVTLVCSVRYHLLQTCLIFPSFVLLALFTFSQFCSVALLKSFQKNSLNTSNDHDK